MKTYILLFVAILACCCHKDVTPNQLKLDATVLSVYASPCSLPLLDFGTNADQIGQLTATGKGARLCSAVSLGKQFNVGDRLSVVIRMPQQNELSACNTMIQGYLTVTVVSGVKK